MLLCSLLFSISVYIVFRRVFYDHVSTKTSLVGSVRQEMSSPAKSESLGAPSLGWEIVPVATTDCTGYEFEVKGNFMDLLMNSKTFRLELARILLQCADEMSHTSAIFWECTPICVGRAAASSNSLRFCVTRARILEGAAPDFTAFSEHFQAAASADVVTFPNLGGDAILIAPTPKGRQNFASLSTWLRETRDNEGSRDAVLEAVGKALVSRVEQQCTTKSTSTIWVSTSGAGVSWLHFRIDNYPKYYTNQRYVAMRTKCSIT